LPRYLTSTFNCNDMKYLLLTFDLEQFVVPIERKIAYNVEELFRVSYNGTHKIIKLLDKHQITSTFFTTYEYALKYPSLIEKIIENNHEIALHGYSHLHNYKTMTERNAFRYLKEAKFCLEKKFNITIKGFRAPRLAAPTTSLLKRLGFIYDSSLHPTFVPGRYFNLLKQRNVFRDNIWEVPISVTPLRFPFSWFWFKNFGLTYSKLCTVAHLRSSDYVNIYFHPWEFEDVNLNRILPDLSLRNNGVKLLKILNKYVEWTKIKELKATAICNYLNTNFFQN